MNMKMRMGVCSALMGVFMLMFVNMVVTVKIGMVVMMVLIHGILLFRLILLCYDNLKFTVISETDK